jgi:hypothetical protein
MRGGVMQAVPGPQSPIRKDFQPSPSITCKPSRKTSYRLGKMPRAIISPSVLASDFGQLTAECKRMIKGGAEWLHMGMLALFFNASSDKIQPIDKMLWTGKPFLSSS